MYACIIILPLVITFNQSRLIEEFMLLANMAVAHRIYKSFPDLAVLRRHPPPQEKLIDSLVSDAHSTLLQTTVNQNMQIFHWHSSAISGIRYANIALFIRFDFCGETPES